MPSAKADLCFSTLTLKKMLPKKKQKKSLANK
jgi:hypothetical protein